MNNQILILSISSIVAIMMLAGSAPEADAAAFMKLGDIKGEATDNEHKDWIIIESMSSAISRSTSDNAKDTQRSRGDTTLGDIVVVRELDKSSTKLQEACANGAFNQDVEIHFTRSSDDGGSSFMVSKLNHLPWIASTSTTSAPALRPACAGRCPQHGSAARLRRPRCLRRSSGSVRRLPSAAGYARRTPSLQAAPVRRAQR